MSASCEFVLEFHGSDENFEKIIDKLYEIEGVSRQEFRTFPLLTINNHQIIAYNGSCHNIWGEYYLQPDADLYLELAKLVPNDSFEVNSYRIYEGGGGGCETFLKVIYEDRKLTFKLLDCVDDISFPFIVNEMYAEYCGHDIRVAISGKSKIFDSVEELTDYIEDWDGIVTTTVTNKTEYLICNNLNSNTAKVRKAKELGIPIISEMKFIRMFCDVLDFEYEQLTKVLSDITYEEFCERLTVDDTITPEVFGKILQNPDEEGMILTTNGEVSLVGNWKEDIYTLNDNGEFVDIHGEVL